MLELNKIFVIEKGKRKMRWKIVEHPYFNHYAIVREHLYMKPGPCTKADLEHICFGGSTLEKAYQNAYDHT